MKLKFYHKSSYQRISLVAKIMAIITFTILIIFSIILIRDKLLNNAKEMGIELAKSYAVEENSRIDFYAMLLDLESNYINENIQNNSDEIQTNLEKYSNNLNASLGSDIIDLYAVIDGKIIAANPWQGDDKYDYQVTSWYQKALDNNGEVIYTDVYNDVIIDQKMITLAKKITGDGNVLAFDITLDNFYIDKDVNTLPLNSQYYLFDSNNNLVYSFDESNFESIKSLKDLADKMRDDTSKTTENLFLEVAGQNNAVYVYTMSNGWISVMCIPIDSILQDGWNLAIVLLLIIGMIFVVIAGYTTIRSYLDNKKNRYINETLQLLGDTYYAIYRIDFIKGTYQTIKCHDSVKEQTGKSGSYLALMETMKQVVEEDTYKQFKESFALNNIQKMTSEGINDFGGDYIRNFDGDRRWVHARIIYDKSLGVNEVIMCFQEIDKEKRKSLQQLELLKGALATANNTVEKKLRFFNNASHDMRTPLNGIIGFANLALKEPIENEKISNYIDKIAKSGTQLLKLINDILEMSRLEQGKGDFLNYQPMNICDCINESISLFDVIAKKEHKTITFTNQVNHKIVNCDWDRLLQIVNNLLSNALKYSKNGAKVDIDLVERDHHNNHSKYQLVIKDTGIGMSKEYLNKLYDPFTRETVFTARNVQGTGLGMPIVKTLIQQMSGDISVQSELNKGTTFTITLPLQITNEKIEVKEEKEVDQNFLVGKRFLLVEDNEINMEIATEMLEMMGIEIIKAYDGLEAVEIFNDAAIGSIDAILMDMQMPRMDGCEATKQIRSLLKDDAKTIPIIAVTANVFAEDVAKTTEAGMNDHIAKPIDYNQLVEVLRKYLN